MDKINVGLCGLGTVGTGVVRVLNDHKERIIHKLGCEVEITKILVNDLEKERDMIINRSWLTDNPDELVEDENIDIIVEVMGGVKGTKELLEKALKNKKHIVTANKDLMALNGRELLQLARENHCDILFDASIAGGIPIVRTLVDGLASDHIEKVMGIVNGTTNFIMTKMTDEGLPFDDVLKEAQRLGFAEADPTSDIEGLDAARKMTLLANLAFKMEVNLDDVEVKGITSITQDDIAFAHSLGYTIKLIGIASMHDQKVEVMVEPTLLPKDHPLANVKNEFNAVYVYGDAVGETMFYGPGAGSLPTATAVVSDLMEVIRNIRLGISGNAYQEPQFKRQIKVPEEKYSKHFIRLEVEDQAGAFQEITNIFTDHHVSFQKILQLPTETDQRAEIVMITHKISKAQLMKSLQALDKIEVVDRVISHYRVDGEE
ncbi:homoserine dehydrogenase [Halolactibacillus alkaliphilus]|uniref:Homoserine dehydrogenase n=1 Tax=Halolactibacillus alkaliphilus TaxID=442899 RepID=A0A511X413_9BACI|nr:homoserine dehydrogenase [Halolactibacillus alkaliphilus]GEN57688.1 homoserine dehydrogenase [Halolactibacillus alkaliphilus]GGN74718.1 homoserine dehydrogenase [Halolactibacillus alkaliphilus]SFP03065.1 homoserine dehydrogenase [Halolactibacillus alkaliphilus]